MFLKDNLAVQDTMSTEASAVHSSNCGHTSESPKFDISNSNQYAVQVALVTMKERCQKLQERLISLERENALLKSSTASTCDVSGTGSASAVEAQLRDKVAQLQSQKSHLTHQIYIVASENKKLFDRLSRLTEANRSLGGHLSRISNTLSRHDVSTSVEPVVTVPTALVTATAGAVTHPPQSTTSRSLSPSDLSSVSLRPEPEGARATGEQGAKEESLEEISSKLIQSILQAKADLQTQYEQMVELQSDHSDDGVVCDGNASQLAVRDLGFSYQPQKTTTEDVVDEAEEEMRALAEKLATAKDALRQQQVQIRALFAAYNSSHKVRCEECEERRREQGELDSLKLWGSGDGQTSSAGNLVHSQSEQIKELRDISEARPAAEGSTSEMTAGGIAASAATVSRSTQCPQDDLVTQQVERELPDGESVRCEKVCPLCSELYGPESSFEEFQNHVMGHFPDTDEDDEPARCCII